MLYKFNDRAFSKHSETGFHIPSKKDIKLCANAAKLAAGNIDFCMSVLAAPNSEHKHLVNIKKYKHALEQKAINLMLDAIEKDSLECCVAALVCGIQYENCPEVANLDGLDKELESIAFELHSKYLRKDRKHLKAIFELLQIKEI